MDSPSGISLLKQLTRPEWLAQPDCDFSVFCWPNDRKARDARWDSGKPRTHCYDKNAMYLGAASSVKLGVGPFHLVEKPTFEDMAGLWQISLHETPAHLTHLPPIAPVGLSWQHTPILRYLLATGYTFDIQEAYLFSEQHAVLRRFYEQVRAIRERDKAAAKPLYTQAFGAMAFEPLPTWSKKTFYRPDWFFGLLAEAKARIFLQIQRFHEADGALPVAIKVDCLYYDQEMPSIPLGTGIGQFKVKIT